MMNRPFEAAKLGEYADAFDKYAADDGTIGGSDVAAVMQSLQYESVSMVRKWIHLQSARVPVYLRRTNWPFPTITHIRAGEVAGSSSQLLWPLR